MLVYCLPLIGAEPFASAALRSSIRITSQFAIEHLIVRFIRRLVVGPPWMRERRETSLPNGNRPVGSPLRVVAGFFEG
jgi:hypothetical protein